MIKLNADTENNTCEFCIDGTLFDIIFDLAEINLNFIDSVVERIFEKNNISALSKSEMKQYIIFRLNYVLKQFDKDEFDKHTDSLNEFI